MGSMLLGVIMSAILYGISLLQTLFYFTRQWLVLACATTNLWFTGYDRDPVYLKALVHLLLASHLEAEIYVGGSYGVPRYLALVLRHPYGCVITHVALTSTHS
jgi:hypothetical protein